MKKNLIFPIIIFIYSFNYCLAQRKVLVEQFTNSGCPPCAANTPVVASYVNSHSSGILMLAYHTAFPYTDSMYYENQFQSDQRVLFYNITGVPTSRVDGNFFSGDLVPDISATLSNAAAVSPRYKITFTSNTIINDQLNASVLFESTDSANNGELLQAMIVVTEKTVLKSSYVCCAGANSESEYPWVVRRMLPDQNGTSLSNTIIGGRQTINVSCTLDNIKDINEIRIIAFVQNSTNKGIYQSEISTPANTTNVSELNSNKEKLFNLNTSVTQNEFNISLNKDNINTKIKVLDLLGNIVYYSSVGDKTITIITSDFTSGVYLVNVSNSGGSQTEKLIVVK